MSAIFERVSIRKFEKEAVSDEKILDIVRAACASPSAGNQQPWEFYIVKSRGVLEGLSKVHKYSGFVSDAAFAIVPCYRAEGLWAPEFAHIDMAACTENMLIRITELGLGATWIGIAPLTERMDIVADVLSLPENLKPFAIIPVGVPAESRAQEDRFDEKRVHIVE